jgi:hypothetical protein
LESSFLALCSSRREYGDRFRRVKRPWCSQARRPRQSDEQRVASFQKPHFQLAQPIGDDARWGLSFSGESGSAKFRLELQPCPVGGRVGGTSASAIKAVSADARNGYFGMDSAPSRGAPRRRAKRPTATSPSAIRNVRLTSTPANRNTHIAVVHSGIRLGQITRMRQYRSRILRC